MTEKKILPSKKKRILAVLIPLGVLCVAAIVAVALNKNPPVAKKRGKAPRPVLSVDGVELKRGSFPVRVKSNGIARPYLEAAVHARRAGEIVFVSERVKPGGFFSQGETLFGFDDFDAINDYRIAESNLRNAKLGGKPSDVVSQLQIAHAKAVRALEDTKLYAPFSGKTLELSAKPGQYVGKGAKLAEIYGTDLLEVELDLNDRQMKFLELPEAFSAAEANPGLNKTNPGLNPEVEILAEIKGEKRAFKGFAHRVSGAIHSQTQTHRVWVLVRRPAGNPRDPFFKVGQFVEARISGATLKNVFAIPRTAVYNEAEVVLLRNGQIERVGVDLLWTDENFAVVEKGLREGDFLVTTPLGALPGGVKAEKTGGPRARAAKEPVPVPDT